MTQTYHTTLPEADLWQALTANATQQQRGPTMGRFAHPPYRVKTQPPMGFTLEKGQKSRNGLYYPIVVTGNITSENGHTRVELTTKLAVIGWLLAGFLVAGPWLVHYFVRTVVRQKPGIPFWATELFGLMMLVLLIVVPFLNSHNDLKHDWQLNRADKQTVSK